MNYIYSIDDLKTIIVQFIDAHPHVSIFKTLFLILIGVGTTILPYSGLSLPIIFTKLADWKNRNAIEYIVLKNPNDESYINILRKCGVFLIEMLWIAMCPLILSGTTELFLLFLNIENKGISEATGTYILFIIIVLEVVLITIISKLESKIVKYFFLITFEILLIIMFLPSIYNIKSKSYVLYILALITICFIFMIIYMINRLGVYKDYKYMIVKISKIIRYLMLCAIVFYFFYKIKFIENDNIFLIWTCFVLFEYIVIVIKDDSKRVDVLLHTDNGEKITRTKIIQLKENKIKYKLINGDEEIIDNNSIKYITYQYQNFLFKKNFKMKKVECILRNNNIMKFQYYKFIKQSWVYFFNIIDGKKNVCIININDIKEIKVHTIQ